MAALTEDYKAHATRVVDNHVGHPVAASTEIFLGALVALDASGNAIPAAAASLNCIGWCARYVDNSAGLAGDKDVRVAVGIARYENDVTNAVDRTHIDTADAKVIDDQTLDNGGGTGPVAGRIVDYDGTYVYVDFRRKA